MSGIIFTRRSFERLVRTAGFEIVRRSVVGMPFEVAERGARDAAGSGGGLTGLLGVVDRRLAQWWPTMFGYQFLYELRPA